MKLIECIPNFSEGRDFQKIDTIVHAIKRNSVSILHTDIGAAANRTVVTAAGSKQELLEAIFAFTETAVSLIDVNKQSGVHPFIGAVDVIPFVPLANTPMEDCIDCAQLLGERIGNELQIPVFLYGKAATHPFRSQLSNLRRGNISALAERMATNRLLTPDFGPPTPHPTAGAVAVGARPVLVAFNVSLKTSDVTIAERIAKQIRSRTVATSNENPAVQANRLPELRAIGWYVAEYGCAQVSMNLTDFTVTPPHFAFERIKELAAEFKTPVLGSELVGLTPRAALLSAGSYYTGTHTGVSENDLIDAAIDGLGLNCHYTFVASDKIIEDRLKQTGILANSTL